MGLSNEKRKDLLEIYRNLKLQKEYYNIPISREIFRKAAGCGASIFEKFGGYKKFQELAEEYFLDSLPTEQRALLSEKSKKFDESATKEDCIKDLRKLKEDNPSRSISRNFYRENGTYSDSTWNRYFGTFEEFLKQARLRLSRQQHTLERQIAKHASVDHYSEYYQTQVAPFYRKYEKEHFPSKIKRMMVISDLHDIDGNDFTLEVFIAECRRKQPDIIVLNGDIFDLYEFSRYGQDPRHVKIKERFQYVHERVFRKLREACPDAQIDFLMGNHEYRLIKHLADATPNLRVLLSDVMGITFSQVFGLDEFKINWVSKFDLAAFSRDDIKEIMKQNHKIYFNTYAVCHEPDESLMKSYSGTNGHHHASQLTSGYNPHMGTTYWVQTAASCERDAEFLNRISKWNKGFLEVIINTELRQAVQYPRPTYDDWTEIDGILYERKAA